MHSQLQAVIDDFGAASEHLRRLRDTVPAHRWTERPAPGGWSVAECVAHLNLTSEAYLPPLRTAVGEGRMMGGGAPVRFRRDFLGWLIARMVGPEVRAKARTSPAFVPTATQPPAEIITRFERLQGEMVELVRQGDGLPLHRLRIPSPFAARMKYSAYSAFTILPRHQHRHLLQADRAWAAISAKE